MAEHTSKIQMEKIAIDRRSGNIVVGIRQDCTLIHSVGGQKPTTLDLPVSFVKNPRGWTAEFSIRDLPDQETMDDAAKKLGDWLVRAGQALLENNPDNVDLNSISVFHKSLED
ncbi:hypothetical protein LMH73_002495 [Vibrio splendidus]|nr:hypothetical protein [Vibrio splendidus]MCC4880452.1 hypothetical protein [Vibrio splendidus]